MWKLYALLAAVFAALTAIFAKIGVKGVPGNLATAIRTTVVLVMAWGIVLASAQGKLIKDIPRSSLWFLLVSGVATGLSWIFYFKALESGPVSRVAPIDKLSMVLVVVMAALFLHEPLDTKTLIGVALIVAGTLVLVV